MRNLRISDFQFSTNVSIYLLKNNDDDKTDRPFLLVAKRQLFTTPRLKFFTVVVSESFGDDEK